MRWKSFFKERRLFCSTIWLIFIDLNRLVIFRQEIAQSASFSMYHFHRIFKVVVGETVAAFTRRLRLELAANRLVSKQLDDITTIAMDCGFSSSQSFAKAFRQHFGTTPTDYSNSKTGNKSSKNENTLSLQDMYDPDTVFMALQQRL